MWLVIVIMTVVIVTVVIVTVVMVVSDSSEKTQKLELWQNSKTETETKHKILKCDKIQKLKLWKN